MRLLICMNGESVKNFLAALAAISVLSWSSNAAAGGSIGWVKACLAPEAKLTRQSLYLTDGGVPRPLLDEDYLGQKRKHIDPLYYQNAAGLPDDALAIILALHSSWDPAYVPGCHVVRALVARNLHNEPTPKKGMKWHKEFIEGGVKVPFVAEALANFVPFPLEGNIRICKSGTRPPQDLVIPRGVTFEAEGYDKHVVVATTKDALLRPEDLCVIAPARIETFWEDKPQRVTTTVGRLVRPSGRSEDDGFHVQGVEATVVADFQ